MQHQTCVYCRNNPRPKSSFALEHVDEFPAFIRFRKNHNHSISDSAALKHRDMSVDTREKLLSLFRAGHAVSSARNFLKMELLLNHPDSYREKMADARYVPSIATVTHLYRTVVRELGSDVVAGSCTKVTAHELKAMMGEAVPPVRRSRPRTLKKHCVTYTALPNVSTEVDVAEVVSELPEPCVDNRIDSCSRGSVGEHEPLATDWCIDVIDEFCSRVKQCVADNPGSFVPAIQTMHRNLSAFAVTEAGLLATLYTMGYYNTSE